MKKHIKAYAYACAIILASFLLSSIIISTLYHFELISSDIYSICSNVFSYTSLLATGIYLGLKIKEKGLIHGAIIAVAFAFISFLIIWLSDSSIDYIQFILKPFTLMLSTIIGVNIKK